MKLQPLDPRLLNTLIRDEEDILTPRAEARRNAISFAPCPRCGGKVQEVLSRKHVFTEGEVLPRTVGECQSCQYAYDPHSGIILNTGDPREGVAEDPYAIHPSDE